MSGSKFDAALSLALARPQGGNVDVSVRLCSQLTADEVRAFQQMGMADADTRRRVLFACLPADALGELARHEKVARLSLVQRLAPNIK
ncbi:hypothetical protein SAMN05428959_103389 [Duganella sp. CF517]|uniref:hypothetical protein n=1 Tax=Duganella sp. CF517 TaxID=1881038 RepID=UPI0008B397AB|nr:hypothetical protein [Duganella sp. CF517]SEN84389.1 hypothetical protein SAMN05428959_103389 [Duganella sp. CF517]